MALKIRGRVFGLRSFVTKRPVQTMSVEQAVSVQLEPHEENLRIRRQLALAYRLIDKMQMNEGVCNHLTALTTAKSGFGKIMLVAPGTLENGAGLLWSEVTASSLIGVDENGNIVEEGCLGGEPEESAACIHLGLRKVLPKATVIMHTHTEYATALACLKNPELLMVHQNGIRFRGRTAFHANYAQPTVQEEAVALARTLGRKDVLFMANHGTLVVSPTVHLAFDETYYLERTCKNLLMCMAATGKDGEEKLAIMPTDVLDVASRYYNSQMLELYAKRHFYAYWQVYAKKHPEMFT